MALVGQRCQDLHVNCDSSVGVCKRITWALPPSTPESVWSGFLASPHPGSVNADRCRVGPTDRGSLLGLLKTPLPQPQEARERGGWGQVWGPHSGRQGMGLCIFL